MDNILKVLVGVLGLAGLLAMLTPSNITVAPAVPEPVVEVAQPVNEVADVPLGGVLPEEPYEETDDEIVKFGEPMIDGNPIGDDEAPQQQNPDNPGQSPSTGNGNGAIDYKQILDNAAQGAYGGVQTYQPAMTTVTPVNEGIPVN